ncbi:MAG: hypothetical protein N2485_03090 [bacterium]|nr:hypothetical protein [bacterium]
MLLTHEIGSLAKPSWRVKPFRNLPIDENDILEAKKWAKVLNINEYEGLINLLSNKVEFSEDDKNKIIYYSSLYAIRLLEKAGLDLVYDGEQHRVEMYEYPIKNIDGFEFRDHVVSFDYKYYRKAAVIDKPKLKNYYHLQEAKSILSIANKNVKIPLTGPYTLVDWSFDEFYFKNVSIGQNVSAIKDSRLNFLTDISSIVKENIKSLIDLGVKYIQIDEPAATTKKNEIDLFITTIKKTIYPLKEQYNSNLFFSIHICFSDYSLLFPYLYELEGIIDEFHFEYANRDSIELGKSNRKGFEILKHFKDSKFIAGLGVIDVHTDFIEPKELIKERILYALDFVGDPYRLYIAPDCGLRTRTWDISFRKLVNMVEAVNEIKSKYF